MVNLRENLAATGVFSIKDGLQGGAHDSVGEARNIKVGEPWPPTSAFFTSSQDPVTTTIKPPKFLRTSDE